MADNIKIPAFICSLFSAIQVIYKRIVMPAINIRPFYCHFYLMVYIFIAIFIPRVASPSQISIAVIYPDVKAPYNSIFSQIIEGINQQSEVKIKEYSLDDRVDNVVLRKKLEDQNTEVIIALGRRGIEVTQTLGLKKPIVIGAASLTPEFMDIYGKSVSAIRLAPDPDLMFSRLRELMPQSKRIIVVTSADRESWLMGAAYEAAKKHDFELLIHNASEVRAAAHLYSVVMDNMRPETDTLWLPPDDESVDVRGILPAILQDAWDRRVAVFGSNPVYVKRGALFALYPDNLKMGRRLATLAMDSVKNGSVKIFPTQDVLMAVNIRTAEHLGLGKIIKKQQEFDVVYPSQ